MFGPFGTAAGYDRLTHKRLRGLRGRIVADVAAAELGAGDRVLDAGTGPGRLPLAIAESRPELAVEGVDLSADMIDHARHTDSAGRVTFTVADVADMPFPDATFALVVSSLSQHHWTDVEGALRDLRRVLRPGGRLWIYDVRFALKRAERAARETFGPTAVERAPVRIGRFPVRLMARLTAQA
ncbi:hypothetical protein GCM10012284_55570 [Mangrovihabitans endophyticus]|uniref:Methyltransferase domain-containing protein n=2 Tax=Mangrovihabitans endophyticus TaxID=1751298 RepID=A0A8J3C5Y8_9ACTN|nr:hypothetical protein GCM10012284_55570 [Mangrovihabitans endophyticus]